MKPITQINKKAFIILIISAGCFGAILLLAMLLDFPEYPNGRHIIPVAKVACGVSLMVFVLSLIYIVLDVFDIFIIQLIIKPIIRWIKKMVLSRLNMYNEVAVKQAENFSPEPENSDSITESQVPCDVLDSIGVPALGDENADKTTETSSSELEKTDNITEENDTNNNIVNDSYEIEEIKEDSEMQSNNLSSSETEEGMVGLQNDGDIVDNNEEEPEVVKEEDKQINGEGESNIDKKQNDFIQNFVIFEGEGRKHVYKIIKETLLASAKNKAADKYSAIILNAAFKMKWICRVPKYNEAVDFFGKKIIDKESTYNRHRREKLEDYNQKEYSIKMLLKSKMQDLIESHYINTNQNADKLK